MLTTTDNPFNPFTDYDEWYAFDERHGYHSTQMLARICVTSHELSEADEIVASNNAVIEIVQENVLGLWRAVTFDGQPFAVDDSESVGIKG